MSQAHNVDLDYSGAAKRLLLEEVARIVKDAKEHGETLLTGYHAGHRCLP